MHSVSFFVWVVLTDSMVWFSEMYGHYVLYPVVTYGDRSRPIPVCHDRSLHVPTGAKYKFRYGFLARAMWMPSDGIAENISGVTG
jgi:hypothetical protein